MCVDSELINLHLDLNKEGMGPLQLSVNFTSKVVSCDYEVCLGVDCNTYHNASFPAKSWQGIGYIVCTIEEN